MKHEILIDTPTQQDVNDVELNDDQLDNVVAGRGCGMGPHGSQESRISCYTWFQYGLSRVWPF